MYRSKEHLLDSVDETESVLSTHQSRLQGQTNLSFDYTTESSVKSTERQLRHTRNPRITVENAEVYQPPDINNAKPVPLPRSKIPKLNSKPPKSNQKVATKPATPKGKELQLKNNAPEKCESSDITSSSSSSVPLATFVVANERKKPRGKRLTKEESLIISSTDDLSSVVTQKDEQEMKELSPKLAEQKTKKHRKKKLIKSSSKQKEDDSTEKNHSLIGIYIHELDFLKYSLDLESAHIRVSLYDQSNGHLLVNSKHKSPEGQPKEIEPQISKPCRFKKMAHLYCVWEELLLVEESDKVLRNNNSIVIFEVIVRVDSSIDFKTVAWAFLKPFQDDKFDNFDKRLQLQVYNFHKKLNIFENWQNTKKYQKYPSTLSITLKAIKKESKDQKQSQSEGQETTPFDVAEVVGGYSSKTFKYPNQIVSSLNLPGKGTNLVKLNYNADLVAISNPYEDGSNHILICTIPDLKIVQTLEGHTDFIYDLNWKSSASSPQTLISCSADQTVLIWTIKKDFNYSLKVIPHVTFVYCSQLWSHHGHEFILSAGKDSIIRVWQPHRQSFKIHQELSKGTGYITSLVVTLGSVVYSGNSEGRVAEWKWVNNSFEFTRLIHDGKTAVSHLDLHPRIEKIFIGISTGEILCMDLENLIIIQRFQMGHPELPKRFFKFRISNCGMFLISVGGGQDIYCWNILTGVEDKTFGFVERSLGIFSSIDMPRKGSFVILGRYKTNQRAVIVVNDSKSLTFTTQPAKKVISVSGQDKEDAVRTTAVKNKLHEIIEKLDKVLVLPQLCDDEKIILSKDMVNEKKRIEEWLDRNVNSRSESPVEATDDDGTFEVERQDSVKSNGTYTVENDKEVKPHRKLLTKQERRKDTSDDDHGEKSEETRNSGTFEVKKKRDTDADDTSVSDSVMAE